MEAGGIVHHFLPMYIAHTAQDAISIDPDTHGSMVVPLLLGSDNTLASNATGQNEFHPLSGPLYPKLSTCFEGTWLTQLVQLVTAGRLFLGHKGRVDL